MSHASMNMCNMGNDRCDNIFLVFEQTFGYSTKMGEVAGQFEFREFPEIG